MFALAVGAILAWWVAFDAARRGRTWYAWGALTWFTTVVGLGVWLVVRRRWPVTASGRGVAREFARAMALALPLSIVSIGFASLMVTYVVQRARVSGHAMEPTLRDGQHVWVNKLAYRQGEPRARDVVMVSYPKNPRVRMVLRVVATGGQRLRIDDGQVFVDDRAVAEDFVAAGYRSHDQFGPVAVPRGSYFLMGDRRNYASDSRRWGLVPRDHILGRITP